MGSATLQVWTAEEVERERAALLAQVALTVEQLDRLAEANALEPDEYRVWRRLQSLDWLLSA